METTPAHLVVYPLCKEPKLSVSTLQAFMVGRLQEMAEIMSKQELKPMKKHPLHLVSLHRQMVTFNCLVAPGAAGQGLLQFGTTEAFQFCLISM